MIRLRTKVSSVKTHTSCFLRFLRGDGMMSPGGGGAESREET